MLLTTEDTSPLKAIDFGLAAFYEPDHLPRTDLGLDGTAWFMAPEVLSSDTYPASDMWSAGVMTYQLLSGFLPFDDTNNPDAPALSVIWQGILTREPSFHRSAWREVSDEAKEFIKALLQKDHTKRPTAKEALKHPWLQSQFHADKKRPLQSTVVQRIQVCCDCCCCYLLCYNWLLPHPHPHPLCQYTRVQRFGQTNILRRTILELIANELLKLAPPRFSEGSHRAGTLMGHQSTENPLWHSAEDSHRTSIDEGSPSGDGGGSSHSGSLFPMSPETSSRQQHFSLKEQGGPLSPLAAPSAVTGRRSLDASHSRPHWYGGTEGKNYSQSQLIQHGTCVDSLGSGGSASAGIRRSPSSKQMALLLKAGMKRGATVHDPGDYWRIMRQASELAAIDSGHGRMDYLRAVPRSEQERSEQRKAARLSLDTSAHGNSKYLEMMSSMEERSFERHAIRKASPGMRISQSMGTLDGGKEESKMDYNIVMNMDNKNNHSDGGGVVGTSIQQQGSSVQGALGEGISILEAAAAAASSKAAERDGSVNALEHGGRGRSAAWMMLHSNQPTADDEHQNATTADDVGGRIKTVKRVTFDSQQGTQTSTDNTPFVGDVSYQKQSSDGTPVNINECPDDITTPKDLEALMNRLQFTQGKGLTHDALAEGLFQLGYELEPTEIDVLMDQLDINKDNSINPSEFVASQLDWGALQRKNRDIWLESAQKAFSDLDKNSDGRLSASELIEILKKKLPPEEVDYALEDAMLQAGIVEAEDVDFEGFLKMLRVGSFESLESLDQYEARLRGSYIDDGMKKLDTVLEESRQQ